MVNPGSKVPHFDAIALSREIVRKVHAAMPIGAENILKDPSGGFPSLERTGKWGNLCAGAAQGGSITWVHAAEMEKIRGEAKRAKIEDTEDKEKIWNEMVFHKEEYSVASTDESIKIKSIIREALNATMFKAGNCSLMSALGLVYFCQWIAAIPDHIPIPSFSFKIQDGPSPVIDHGSTSLMMNGQYVLCDIWLKDVFEINHANLITWREKFERTERPPEGKRLVNMGEQNKIWNEFLRNILNRSTYRKDIFVIDISTREKAKKIADIYERSLQEAVLSLYNDELFNEKNMTSLLNWHGEPVQHYLIRRENRPTLHFYERTNIKAIDQFIKNYEFPLNIPGYALMENIHLYVYLFANDNYVEKESTKVFARNLIKCTYESKDHILGLKIYAAQVLARFDKSKNDPKAIALKNAWLNNALVDLCDALKMKPQPVNSFWTEINDWEAMPNVLKNYAEEVLHQNNQRRVNLS